jgi:hypothetical protein
MFSPEEVARKEKAIARKALKKAAGEPAPARRK